MKVLIIGSGGREHALVKVMAASPQVTQVLVAPGNPGMAEEASCFPVAVDDLAGLLRLAQDQKVDLTIVGPELPLTLGLVDIFRSAGLKIFGPDQKAAVLEASKVFTKHFLKKYKIPTARYEVFEDLLSAKAFLHQNADTRWVIKVDGLAAGKGVFVTQNVEEALAALDAVFISQVFGKQPVVIEEFLEGEELSYMVLCDGTTALPLASSQDHKRLLDGDQGPNTGGMGAYSPAPVMTQALEQEVLETIIHPTLRGMQAEGRSFTGVLYAGLMIRDGKPYVLEYNVRFGDPEAEVLLPRLKSDWLDLFLATTEHRLEQAKALWKNQVAVAVVLAAEGYPSHPKKGAAISGLADAQELGLVFHAGTTREQGEWKTSGGRVLTVTALGKDLPDAIAEVYEAVEKIRFAGMQYRRDIATRGLGR